MSTTRRIGTVAFVAAAALVCAGRTFAQMAPVDHWNYVPPLATTCFSDDGFLEKLGAARTAINAAREQQEQVNIAAKEKFDTMDPMERMQRMQAFMMKNPAAAAKLMQAAQESGAKAAGATDADAAAKQLLAELPQLQARFRAALEEAVKPVHARRGELIETKAVAVGEVGEPMFTNAADHAHYVQLIAEENAAIERACVPFFGANGSFHNWLASYRAEVTEKVITAGSDATDVMNLQLEALDLPGGGYRSTNPLQQVGNYVATISQVYAERPARVQPRIGLRK